MTALAYEACERRPISELQTDQNRDAFARLLSLGLESYRRSPLAAGPLAARSLAKTISAWPGDPDAISAILYCSERLSEDDKRRIDFDALCNKNGIANKPVIGLALANCANFAPGIRVARALIRSEGLRNIAVVTTSNCRTEDERLAYGGLAVLSDAAASCIVSADERNAAFRICGIGHAANPRVRHFDLEAERPKMIMTIAAGVQRALRLALDDAGVDRGHLRYALSTLTHREAMHFFAQQCGIEADNVFTETLRDFSHCYAADIIISLLESRDWRHEPGRRGVTPFLILAMSLSTWSAIIVEPASTNTGVVSSCDRSEPPAPSSPT
jgi:3-oxoacyl-[acyl-carrier-protein] synthase-3